PLSEPTNRRWEFPSPPANRGEVGACQIDAGEFAHPCVLPRFLLGCLHPILGNKETGEFKLAPNRLAKLETEQPVGVPDLPLPAFLAPVSALVPAEVDLVHDGAQGKEGQLLMR